MYPELDRSLAGRRTQILQGVARTLLPLYVLELLALHKRHGLDMAERIKGVTADLWSPSPGTLYPLLGRMEGEGFIESEWQSGRAAARRVYKLTQKGRRRRGKLRSELREELEVADAIIQAHLTTMKGDGPLVPTEAA